MRGSAGDAGEDGRGIEDLEEVLSDPRLDLRGDVTLKDTRCAGEDAACALVVA